MGEIAQFGSNIEGNIGFQKLQNVRVEKALMSPHVLKINHTRLFQYSELILLMHLR